MGKPFTEKGSCRAQHYNSTLDQSLFCHICTSHAKINDKVLRRNFKKDGKAMKGLCQELVGTLPSEIVLARELYINGNNKKRNRTCKEIFSPHIEIRNRCGDKNKRNCVESFQNANPMCQGCDCNCMLKEGKESSESFSKTKKALNTAVDMIIKQLTPAGSKMKCHFVFSTEDEVPINKLPAGIGNNSSQRGVLNRAPVLRDRTSFDLSTAMSQVGDSAPSLVDEVFRAAPIVDDVPVCVETVSSKKYRKLMTAMGTDLVTRLVSMPLYKRRAILAAYCKDHSKVTVESVIGKKISHNEWNKINIHRRYPGPYESVIKPKVYRQKIRSVHLQRLLTFLHQPGYLQRVAFGNKVQEVMDGADHRFLDNIARAVSLQKITIDFLQTLDQEASYQGDLLSSETRCQCIERKTFRRCLHPRDHKADGTHKRCKFTSVGSLSVSTIENYVKSLTSGQIKALSGLDDTKEVKGRKSFEHLRILTERYIFDAHTKKSLLEDIDSTEMYYQTDFSSHLERNADHACACLTCGYSVS